MTLWGPGLSGSVAVTLVETHNATLSGAGRERVEYFAQHLTSEDGILNNSTSCATARGHGGVLVYSPHPHHHRHVSNHAPA